MNLLDLIHRRGQMGRLAEIVRVLARYGLADWLKLVPREEIRNLIAAPQTRALAELTHEARIREAITELGPTFVKLGQILSTRADLIGPDLATELSQLQSATPADAPAIVRRIVCEELGADPERLFAEFEPTAFASASLGQVHRAKLRDGRAVIVKVQHDGTEDRVRLDLELVLLLAGWLQDHVPAARPYQPVATAREFRRTLLRELDYTAEKRNAEQFRRNFQGDATIHVPHVFSELSSRRVLTMELLVGVPGSAPERLRETNVDPSQFARHAANMYLEMIFRDGFYHADPHPGNVMVLPGGVVGVLDCGMIGRIDGHLRESFEELLLALAERDSEGLSELLLRLGAAPPDVDRTAFRSDVSEFLAEYGSQSLKEFDLGGALRELTAIIRRHHILLPSSASLLLKTLIMLEGTARQFSPDFNLAELLERYHVRLAANRLDPRRWLIKVRRVGRDLDRLIAHGPRDLADILDRVRDGTFEVKHEHHRLEVTVNRLVAGLLTAALFVGSSQVLSSAVPPLVYGISFLGALGSFTAVFMGWRLLRAVTHNDWSGRPR
ncbi:MAG: AarF/ABC1/UbiB kinase family protein [Gemmataceae bacterium]